MEFLDRLQAVAKHVENRIGNITTKEETKDDLVVPFIQALGYDILNPGEVLSRVEVDAGTPVSQRIYCVVSLESKPVLLFECIPCDVFITETHADQLRGSFNNTSARIGVLTNGISYWFYSDLEEKDLMDEKPFLDINLLDLDGNMFVQLEKLTKEFFDLGQILADAGEWKYIRLIKNILLKEAAAPSAELLGFLTSRMYPGMKTMPETLDMPAAIVQKAFKQFLSDHKNDQLNPTINDRIDAVAKNIHYKTGGTAVKPPPNIAISDEEFEKFFIVDIT